MSRKKFTFDNNFPDRLRLLIQDYLKISQKAFCCKIGLSESYLSMMISGKRDPSAELIAGVFIHYREFLHWLLTGEGGPTLKGEEQPAPENVVEMQHMDLIRGFKDKQRALNINRELMELEKLDPEMFQRVESYIKGTVDTLKEVAERKTRYGPDRRQGERRKSDSPQGPPGSLERRKGRDRRKIA